MPRRPPSITVHIRGLAELEYAFRQSPQQVSVAIDRGLRAAAAVVQQSAIQRVHSPEHPWPDRKDGKLPTGKLQSSLAIGAVEGSGLAKSILVGHPHGRAISKFGRSFDTGRRTRSGKRIAGSHRNISNVTKYGPVEERRHPFLAPALAMNVAQITAAFHRRMDQVLRSLGVHLDGAQPRS